MKVSMFMVLRHYASVPTNLFQISTLDYGALNEFPQSKDSKNKRQRYSNRKTMVPLYLSREEDQQFLPPPILPLPPPLHIQ